MALNVVTSFSNRSAGTFETRKMQGHGVKNDRPFNIAGKTT